MNETPGVEIGRDVRVIGPAYLDRVVLADRSLVGPGRGSPLDHGVEGTWRAGPGLTLIDPGGGRLGFDLPDDWSGPSGNVALASPILDGSMRVRGLGWHDDLGGMGAGYAAALGGELVCALGPDDDPTTRAILDLLGRIGIAHRPIRVEGRPADWTLLVTSGPFGDKLPIGFRGCHATLSTLGPEACRPCGLRLVAALPNRLAAEALDAPGADLRAFAPSLRNMVDRSPPLVAFAGRIDLLSCNRVEWDRLDNLEAESIARAIPIVAITEGPRGALVRFRRPGGGPGEVRVGAFPRDRPPIDTNRAGEAFASTLITALRTAGWAPGSVDESSIRRATIRASAAAALVLDRADFGFPGPDRIDTALEAGRVFG